MFFDPDNPYNDPPILRPKSELETKAVLRKAIAANKALVELKGEGDLIPNQGVLINAIVLQEAKLSSEIVNAAWKHVIWPVRHIFARRTYFEDMFKKARFLDISQERVHDGAIFFQHATVCSGAILKSRQIKPLLWRDSAYGRT